MQSDSLRAFSDKLQSLGFQGDVDLSAETRDFYSHDASMFELRPELVVFPKDARDVSLLVRCVTTNKSQIPNLSVTARSAGTDMSGGAINDSVIVDFQKYFQTIGQITSSTAAAQPGVFYRDFEAATLQQNALMPTYPASRDLCTIGGMVNNNSGGEKSLEYGKTNRFITSLKVVFADGIERVVEPLSRKQLDIKMAQQDFEGYVYRELFRLIEDHYDQIKLARPNVSKNSTGYSLWDVWDRSTGVFDLTQLICGAQGTLGFVTECHFRLVPQRPHSGLLVLFMHDSNKLGELVNVVLKHKPATFEGFDDATLRLTIRFMPYFLKMLGLKKFIHLLLSLIPDGLQLLRGIPKMVLMVEFNGATEDEVRSKIRALHGELSHVHARYEINGFEETPTAGKSEKFWIMRRHAFNLLRKNVKDKHTAPFIDDLVVNPSHLPEFLPQLRAIIKKYKLLATIQGHIGDGNFHVIPLMKLQDQSERDKLLPAMKEVDELVLHYKGSLSGEHNDGLVRGPWLTQMYGPEVVGLFKAVKATMDPDNIFNPHKKADADWDYSFSHIRDHF